MDLPSKGFGLLQILADSLPDDLGRCQSRIAEPVMPDHSPLVWIGDRTGFWRRHGLEGTSELGGEMLNQIVSEAHPTDFNIDAETLVVVESILKTLPKRAVEHGEPPGFSERAFRIQFRKQDFR